MLFYNFCCLISEELRWLNETFLVPYFYPIELETEAELLIFGFNTLLPESWETGGPLEPDETLKLEFLLVEAVS